MISFPDISCKKEAWHIILQTAMKFQPGNSYMTPQILPSVLESLRHKLKETLVILQGIFVVQVAGRGQNVGSSQITNPFSKAQCLSLTHCQGQTVWLHSGQFPFRGIGEIFPKVSYGPRTGPFADIKRESLSCISLWSAPWNIETRTEEFCVFREAKSKRK